MNRTLDKIICKRLAPVMSSKGFAFDRDGIRDNSWAFAKQGSRAQNVIVYNPCKGIIKLSAGVSPSSKYGHLEEREDWKEWIKGHPAHWDPALHWWTYGSDRDMEEILDTIVLMLGGFLFDLLDGLEKEPEERLFPDAQKEQSLYANHRQYQLEFLEKYGPFELSEAGILQALDNAILLWKKESADCEHEILLIAAMYGKLFDLKGGRWEKSASKGKLFHAEIHIPNRKWFPAKAHIPNQKCPPGFIHQVMPLVDTYRIVQNQQPAAREYEMILQYTGN